MAYHYTDIGRILVNIDYNVEQVSVGMAGRVAAISNRASERATPVLTVNHCVLASV